MALPTYPASKLDQQSVRVCRLWLIFTSSGLIAMTDHNTVITFFGIEFLPSRSFMVTSRESENGEIIVEAIGVIDENESIGTIHFKHVLGQRFKDATISEFLVDWKYPWLGGYGTEKFWMGRAEFDKERFKIPLEGVARFMSQTRGRSIQPICVLKLFETGDGKCNAPTAGKIFSNVVIASVTSRKQFTITGGTVPGSLGADFFADAEMSFEDGENLGWKGNVLSHTDSASGAYNITLHLPTPHDISPGDEITLEYPCNRTVDNCQNIHANLNNFGAENNIPGSETAVNIERAKKI